MAARLAKLVWCTYSSDQASNCTVNGSHVSGHNFGSTQPFFTLFFANYLGGHLQAIHRKIGILVYKDHR